MASRYVPNIVIDNLNLGGISESVYQGGKGSVASLVGFDIHSVPGRLRVNQQLTKISGSTVDDFVLAFVPCSDGFTYAFGSTNGKVWKIDVAAGTVTLVATVAPASGSVGILDAKEYDGYIYYATSDKLGRVAVGAPTDWTTRNDNFQTFTNKDTLYHPMLNHDVVQVLYIGDGNLVAQYDSSGAGAFTPNALKIPKPLRISALGKQNTNLLVGTNINNGINKTQVFVWNTWSVSFSSSDFIDEVGINAFIPGHDVVLVNAGLNGNMYSFNGVQLVPLKQIQCGGNPNFSPTATAKVYPNAVANVLGIPIFGLSNITGNPTMQGVYSFGRKDSAYPRVLALEVPISTGNFTNVVIGAIAVIGNDVLVSWKDTTSGTVYGIDKKDYTAKYTAPYFETRVMRGVRNYKDTYKKFIIEYDSLPSGTGGTIQTNRNNAGYGAALTTIVDTEHNHIYAEDETEVTSLQAKVGLTVNGNTAPEITGLVMPLVILFGKMRYQ